MNKEKITFEEEINRYGKLIYPNVGFSMMPMLRQGRDLMVISRKPTKRLKKYDVVLYRHGSRYILHRILKVCKNDYVICGDHNWRREYGITDEHIVGVLTAFVRDGVEISVTDRRYQMYVHLWCDFFYLRAMILWCKSLLQRIRKRWRE